MSKHHCEQVVFMNNSIRFLDLVSSQRHLRNELVNVFVDALETGGFIGGKVVQQFEESFAAFCGTRHCVGVGSGTDALRFALIASGVQPGDVVVTVPNTFIATAEAISQAGAHPEFVDIDERTYNMDPERLQQYLLSCLHKTDGSVVSRRSGRRVTAIVPVHLYGQIANMDPILELAEAHDLLVIEDACQAHGAEYFSAKTGTWKKAGSLAHAAAFSFYPGKNLGACGEAGAVTTNSELIAAKIRMLRDHGQARKYVHEIEGYNGRLDSIQAGILHAKLPHLRQWNEQRRSVAARYRQQLAGCDEVALPYEPEYARSNYHLFVIRLKDRDLLLDHLKECEIGAAVHYPIPIHCQPAFRYLGYHAGDFPVAERLAQEVISLPMYPHLQEDQQDEVEEEIRQLVGAGSRPALQMARA